MAEGAHAAPDVEKKTVTTFAAGPQCGSGEIERFACVEDDGCCDECGGRFGLGGCYP